MALVINSIELGNCAVVKCESGNSGVPANKPLVLVSTTLDSLVRSLIVSSVSPVLVVDDDSIGAVFVAGGVLEPVNTGNVVVVRVVLGLMVVVVGELGNLVSEMTVGTMGAGDFGPMTQLALPLSINPVAHFVQYSVALELHSAQFCAMQH